MYPKANNMPCVRSSRPSSLRIYSSSIPAVVTRQLQLKKQSPLYGLSACFFNAVKHLSALYLSVFPLVRPLPASEVLSLFPVLLLASIHRLLLFFSHKFFGLYYEIMQYLDKGLTNVIFKYLQTIKTEEHNEC